MATDLSGRS